MVRYYIGLVSCAIFFLTGETLKLPSNFILCHRNDHFDKCLEHALEDALLKLKDGLPDFKIPPLDPLKLDSLTLTGGNGPVSINHSFTNLIYTGISKSTVANLRISITPPTFAFQFDITKENLELNSDYNMTGRILLIPINGVGKCVIKFSNFTTHGDFSGVIEQRNGKEYFRLENVKTKMHVDNAHYDFDNFFNGNKDLGKQINDVLNENWKEVFEDVREGCEMTFAYFYKIAVNNLFSKVPYNEIFLP